MENVLKFWTLFSFCSQVNCSFQGWNSLNACQNSKQGRPWSDLGLHFLSRPFWQSTDTQNFRTFVILFHDTKRPWFSHDVDHMARIRLNQELVV